MPPCYILRGCQEDSTIVIFVTIYGDVELTHKNGLTEFALPISKSLEPKNNNKIRPITRMVHII